MDWQSIATAAQASIRAAIPTQYRLSPTHLSPAQTDKTGIPRTCGLLTPRQLEITETTATELVRRLRSGELSAVEVTEAFCGRAGIAAQLVNCLAHFFPEEALERAKELDAHLAATGKPVGPLHGLPVAVKDTYHMKGQRTTMAYVAWYDNIAEKDSTMVKILRDAGAVFYCRTTMPQTGMLLETWSNLFGRTLNPRNTNFGSGGSSGGDGALIAMHGAPIAPSSDIGGSIRGPAAFNGLYGIRPTADRVPKTGMTTAKPGNVSIKVSCGPNCHSVADLKLLTNLILTHPTIPFEPTAAYAPWREDACLNSSAKGEKGGKMSFGLLMTDGVVDPHPPIRRAMLETAEKLRAEGHEVFEWTPDFDFWEAALCTWKLYFQTGAKETLEILQSAGEPVHPTFMHYLKTFNTKELTASELLQTNVDQAGHKYKFMELWTNTATHTRNNRTMDALICPAGPCAGIPHDFPIWWGYFSIFNLLDYPSTILPIKDLKIDAQKDAKDMAYKPRNNPFDKQHWEVYDPELWKNQPVCLQMVNQPYRDEELIGMTEVIDGIVNGAQM